eukprot:TRINITY_DN30990_c0_g1_i1.p1 TRINITY_DN30990_c0_g1~~TRINITY_DN30990_c0_g1_i1.p1  ORF type:complete len:250 (+),score=37.72 TRINITY_DN30990_c0_g1_i1:64-813(+)
MSCRGPCSSPFDALLQTPSECRSSYEADYVAHPYVAHRVPKEQAKPQRKFECTSTSRADYSAEAAGHPKGARRCELTPGRTVAGLPFYQGRSEAHTSFRSKDLPPLGAEAPSADAAELAVVRKPAKDLPPLKRAFCGTTTATAAYVQHSPEAAVHARGRMSNRQAKQRSHNRGLGLGGATSAYRWEYSVAATSEAAQPRAVRKPQMPACYTAERWGGGHRSAARVAQGAAPSKARGAPWGPSSVYSGRL